MAQASAEKFEQTGPAEQKKVVSAPQGEWSRTLQYSLTKKKGTKPLVHVIYKRVKVCHSSTLARKLRVKAKVLRRTRYFHREGKRILQKRERENRKGKSIFADEGERMSK